MYHRRNALDETPEIAEGEEMTPLDLLMISWTVWGMLLGLACFLVNDAPPEDPENMEMLVWFFDRTYPWWIVIGSLIAFYVLVMCI